MTRIAISGHRGFSAEVTGLIDAAIRSALGPYAEAGGLVGVSCLAEGADQIFARAVLDLGGELAAIVPAHRYREAMDLADRPAYDALLAAARTVCRMHHVDAKAQAHMDASIVMLDGADRLFAVWDGQPARAFGGTADVVDYARGHDIPVTVLWPVGAARA